MSVTKSFAQPPWRGALNKHKNNKQGGNKANIGYTIFSLHRQFEDSGLGAYVPLNATYLP